MIFVSIIVSIDLTGIYILFVVVVVVVAMVAMDSEMMPSGCND